jgi:Domain of unknown function (DUF1996)
MQASSQRAWLQVHLALMLVLGVAAAAAYVATLMWWKAPVASAQQATFSNASFVVRCDFSHRKRDDPIVFSGERGAAHSHEFFGNRSTNYASTYKSLRATTPTTCFNPADKAAYWMPTMKWGSRTFQPSYALLYYRAAPKAPKQVQPHPPGLKVVTNENSHATWRCLAGRWATSPPTRCSNGTLVVRIRFPDCSDGKLDSADHRSHMAYAVRQSDGTWGCPTTHKKPVPALSMNVHFPIPSASGKVRLSSGAASTIHADFFNAWDQQKLAALVRSCINAYPFSTKNPKPARCKATGSSSTTGGGTTTDPDSTTSGGTTGGGTTGADTTGDGTTTDPGSTTSGGTTGGGTTGTTGGGTTGTTGGGTTGADTTGDGTTTDPVPQAVAPLVV